VHDCVFPAVCDESGACVGAPDVPLVAGGCVIARAPVRRAPLGVLGVFFTALALHRRRRSSR
jgi:hypothetical protein